MPEQQEKLLHWNTLLQRWEYAGTFLFWMTDATLKAYIQAWYTLYNIERPTAKQKSDVLARCLRVRYYEHICDPDIHVIHSARPRV